MARRTKRPPITRRIDLVPVRRTCSDGGGSLWNVYQNHRTVTTLDDVCRLTLTVVRCHNPACPRYHRPSRPEEEGAWALPHHEFGLDVIALVGTLRFAQHRSVPEIHQALRDRQVAIAERTVTHLVARYEELVALRLADDARRKDCLAAQKQVVLAIDGLQPHTDQDVLWVLRDVLSGEVLLARSLASARKADLADLLREVKQALPVPIHAVISDGQPTIRLAVQQVVPEIPHQLCQYHDLKEAAKLITAADHHAQTELKKQVRGVRDIERSVAERADPEAQVIRGYCLAVRSALTDGGKPPLQLPGLALHDRLVAIQRSLDRVQEKKGCLPPWTACTVPSPMGSLPRSDSGHPSKRPTAGSGRRPRCSPTTPGRMRRPWSGPIVPCSPRS